jgi:hypothetical protein
MLQDIDVDYDALEESLQTMPAQYTYWAAVFSTYKALVAQVERRTKTRRGVIAREAVSKASEHNVKLTDTQLKTIIEADEDLVKLEMLTINMQANANKLYHMLEAIRMKSDHCRSLAGFKRQEREGHKGD